MVYHYDVVRVLGHQKPTIDYATLLSNGLWRRVFAGPRRFYTPLTGGLAFIAFNSASSG